jgi:dTDP-glucose pyrophosphorylase
LNRIGEFPLAQFQKSPQEGKMTITTADAPSVQTLIMAGGRGERLYPLTVSRPKPTVPFGGVFRIVDFTLSNCLNSGLTNVSLLTQYRHQELQSYIQQNWSGLWSGIALEPLECILPRSAGRYRGTADAVFQNVDKLKRPGSEMVVILSADQVYHMDYREILSRHASTQADVTIGTVERPLNAAKDFGVVEVDSDYKVVGFEEEPALPRPSSSCQARALVNMGVYVFRKEILLQVLHENCRTESEFDFAHHIIPSLIGSANVRAYDFRDRAGDLPGYWRNIERTWNSSGRVLSSIFLRIPIGLRIRHLVTGIRRTSVRASRPVVVYAIPSSLLEFKLMMVGTWSPPYLWSACASTRMRTYEMPLLKKVFAFPLVLALDSIWITIASVTS